MGELYLSDASVLVCTYNNEKFIRETMDSICSFSIPNLDIVVMDDCSQDETYNIVLEYAKKDSRIRLFRNEQNIGVAKNAKRGIRLCKGRYVFFAAGDDVSFPDRIERGLKIFKNDPNVGIIVGHCQVIDEHSNVTGDEYVIPRRVTNKNISIQQFKRNYCLGACMAIRKDEKILEKDYVLQLIDDYQLSLEYLLMGYRIFIDRHPLIRYRIHSSNISNDRANLYQKTMQALQVYNSQQIVTFLRSQCYSEKEILTAVGIFNLFRGKMDEGYHYLMLGNEQKSEDTYVNYENLFYLGVAMWRRKHYDQALRYFLEAKEMYSSDASVYNNIGVLKMFIEKNANMAYEMFTSALQIQPQYLDCQHNLKMLMFGDSEHLKFTERIIEERLITRKWYKTGDEI